MSGRTAPYEVYGQIGSPYTCKIRAILRYRHLPYRFYPAMGGQGPIAHVKPPVIPVVRFPDGSWQVDSTPIIDALESCHPNERSINPSDPADVFLAYLIEDFADEWVTKLMFNYRWFREVDQVSFAREGVFDGLGSIGRDRLEQMADLMRRRQVERMSLVGCTEQNRPVIEAAFEELVQVLDHHVTEQRFLFGSRPSRADFGLYGQFSQLVNDPTPSARMRELAPYAWRWVQQVDDLCGLEGEWRSGEAPPAAAVAAILRMTSELYLPFLAANTAAFARGDDTFSLPLGGQTYTQRPFKYQVKCLAELRGRFASLEGAARERVEALLVTGAGRQVLLP